MDWDTLNYELYHIMDLCALHIDSFIEAQTCFMSRLLVICMREFSMSFRSRCWVGDASSGSCKGHPRTLQPYFRSRSFLLNQESTCVETRLSNNKSLKSSWYEISSRDFHCSRYALTIKYLSMMTWLHLMSTVPLVRRLLFINTEIYWKEYIKNILEHWFRCLAN